MRFCAQIAEKSGYTVAGITAAYGISGIPGIISFGLCMLLFANPQSKLIFDWRLSLGSKTLRISLILRALSFVALVWGVKHTSLGFMLLGAALSGLFVGLFWPTFYTMKKEEVGGWFVFEKTSGVMLIISTGVLLVYANLLWILLVSLLATLLSFAYTFRISGDLVQQYSTPPISFTHLSKPRNIAFLDGAIGESLRMIRRLALLSGTVTLLGMEGVLSFALVLAVSEAGGAILSKMAWFDPIHYIALALSAAAICILGPEFWLYGLLLMGVSLSALFPLIQKEVKAQLDLAGATDLNFRERKRSQGRAVGAIFASAVFLLPLPLEIVFLGIILALAALAQCSENLFPPRGSSNGTPKNTFYSIISNLNG